MAITLKVNKQPRTIDVPGDTPLLWVLRDVLGLAGRDRARSKSMVCTKQGVGVAGAAFVPSLGLVFGDLAGAHIGTNREQSRNAGCISEWPVPIPVVADELLTMRRLEGWERIPESRGSVIRPHGES